MKWIKNESSSTYGKMMFFEGIMIQIPIFIVIFYPSDYLFVLYFIVPGLISCILGIIICICSDKARNMFDKSKGSKIVLFAWIYGFLLAAFPFLALDGYNYSQIIFESVSGLTTTGLSVLDVTKLPTIFLFYRSFLQFMGGLGFVLMMLIFVQGKDSMELYTAEGHPDRLMPNIGKTARVIAAMYGFFLILGILLYKLSGMPIFDGIINSMCALSTGGFSNKLNSIGEYQSLKIEFVTIFLMLIGTTNFAVLLLAVKGKWKKLIKVSEIRFLTVLTMISVPIISIFLIIQNNFSVNEAIRSAFFNAFSALSTTGFATSNYSDWQAGAIGMMVILMLIGGGVGSTAGGIKLVRVYLVFRLLWENLKKRFRSDRQIQNMYYTKPTEENCKINNVIWEEAITYLGTYLFIYIIGTLFLTGASGCSLPDAMFEFASSLGTVGLSVGVTSYTANHGTLWIEIIGMILGRLEIFTVFLGIYHWSGSFCSVFKKK